MSSKGYSAEKTTSSRQAARPTEEGPPPLHCGALGLGLLRIRDGGRLQGVPFAARSARVEARPAPPRVGTYDYGYVLRELRRIAMIGGVMLVLVVVFPFLLR